MTPQLVHYLPLATTVIALVFAWIIFQRSRERRGGPHLRWRAAGVMTFAVGTFTEGLVTLFGWNPFIFRSWYIAGALLGKSSTSHRLVGNVYIAVGALLPAIGGSLTRFGYTDVLYVTELVGLSAIYIGYRYNIREPAPAVRPATAYAGVSGSGT